MRKGYEKKYESRIPKENYPDTGAEQLEALKSSKQLEEFHKYREAMKDLPCMPSYHFWAPDGKINDPNGLCFWKGRYHLFYQAYPPADPRQHWGHAVSDDMIHWKDLPLAIYPDIEYAVFSGSSLVEEDRVIAMYHGFGIGNMIATSSDPLLLNWEKNENCPVIPHIEASVEGKPYRIFDPFLWKEENGYYALSGSYYGGENDRHTGHNNVPVEHLFFSQDLSEWTYIGELSPIGFPQEGWGNDGACPYFWPIGNHGKYLFFHFSHQTGSHCFLGSYDKVTHHFTPEKHIHFCHGPVGCSSYQAPCLTPDGSGGLYLIYNTTDADMTLKRQGAMTVMHHVTTDEQDNICIQPVKQIESLHTEHYTAQSLKLDAFKQTKLDFSGRELDIHMKLHLSDARGLTLKVLASDNSCEHTDINLYRSRRKRGEEVVSMFSAVIDTTYSSVSPDAEGRQPEVVQVPDVSDDMLDVRILVDRCMVEVFVNGRITIMQMMYTSESSTGIFLEALGHDVMIDELDIWKMSSIY